MPLYEYRCDACEHQFEVIQRFSDDPISVCPSCGAGPVVKLLSSPAIQFKGSGWYITDYARKGQSAGDSKPAGKEKDAATPAAAGETKSAPAASTPSASTSSTPAKD
jgi:putative FmdB family regulatory protein